MYLMACAELLAFRCEEEKFVSFHGVSRHGTSPVKKGARNNSLLPETLRVDVYRLSGY
jgi:hypothetical protein